jgi:hypothetical protein
VIFLPVLAFILLFLIFCSGKHSRRQSLLLGATGWGVLLRGHAISQKSGVTCYDLHVLP